MTNQKQVIVVIPAYEPNDELLTLIQKIRTQTSYKVIIVDDGSGTRYAPIFEEARLEAYVIGYKENQGKGSALKTAFSYIQKRYKEEAIIVTADADGQHQVKDIIAVAEDVKQYPKALILGTRSFDKQVPVRSRLGNKITSFIFQLSSGIKIKDTQTGLRAFDGKALSYLLKIQGSHYEYEMNMLMNWAKDQKEIYENPIETIYMKENSSSHFQPIKDSFLIYKEIIKFSCSSFIAFLADYILYALLIILTKGLPINLSIGISNVGSRIMSAILNFNLNRRFVFKSDNNVFKTALQYAALATGILVLNTLLLALLVHTFIANQFIAKIVVELVLFIVSCTVQKQIIFKKAEKVDGIGEGR